MIGTTKFIKKHFGISLKMFKTLVLEGRIVFDKEKSTAPIAELLPEEKNIRPEHIQKPTEIAIIAKSEIDYISRCILDYKHVETGGQLFGDWTADGTPRVLYAIGPGRNANHQSTFFNQDVDYLVKVGRLINEKFGLQHIGEWHSHHQLGLAHPSGHDASTMATSIKNNHLGRFLLCIGNCTDTASTLNAFNFTEDTGLDYVHAKWLVKQYESMPLREMIDREFQHLLIHPKTSMACHGNLHLVNATSVSDKPKDTSPFAEGYWLNDKDNAKEFAKIKQYLENKTGREFNVKLVERDKTLSLTAQLRTKNVIIHFPLLFPNSAPQITLTDDWGLSRSLKREWFYNGDIKQSFVNYITDLL